MTWWEGRWVARMMMTPAARPRATRSRVRRGEVLAFLLGADGGGEVGVLVDDDQVDGLAGVAGDLAAPGGEQVVVAGVHDAPGSGERGDGVGDGRADEHVGAGPPRAQLDLLAVDQDELAVMRQRAVGGDQVQPGGFARAGFAAEQDVAFGQVDVDVLAVLVLAQVHRVEHGEREGRDRRQRLGVAMVVMTGASFRGGQGGAGGPRGMPGTAAPVRPLGRARPGSGTRARTGRVVRGQPRQGGGDGVAGREGVAADDVDGHQLGPAAVAGDPGVAGVAGGAELADVGVEVLGADACPAQHPGPFPDLGRPDPQDEREPPGPGVQPGFVAQPLEPVPGQDAPEPPGDEPAGVRHGQDQAGERRQDDCRPR